MSLLELLIVVVVLGILASVVIPMTANATEDATEVALKRDLREIRMAIEKYKAEHAGVTPGYPDGDTAAAPTEKTFIAQLCQATTVDGLLVLPAKAIGELAPIVIGGGGAGGRRFGPYLSEMPENPLNGSSRVRVVDDLDTVEIMNTSNVQGWVYRARDGRFQSNVDGKARDGTLYEEW
jgi:type II secretory pathway pseudopilin PulG